MTEVAVLTVPAVTVNVANVAPCATVTLAGTLTAVVFELDSDITAPPVGAAAVSVTVPVPDCALTIVVGLTATLLSAAAATAGLMVRPNVSLAPAYDAFKVTGVGLVTVPALTVNVAELAPCATVTLDGSLAPAGEELRATVAPPLGAADVKATVQVAVEGGVMDTELHENPFRPSWIIVTVPPVLDTDTDEAAALAPSSFVSCIDDEVSVVVPDSIRDTVATTPLSTAVVFSPHNTHVAEPALLLQESDLFAAAGPAAIVADEKSTVE